MNEPTNIPTDVLEGLRFVQASGEANMFDVPRVAQSALRAGYTQTADWLLGEENREAYVRGALYGFPSEGEQGRATEPIKIPGEVYSGLEYVRESGETNMFDTEWLGEKENHANYMLGVLRGFRPLQGEDDA
jgi:hypothetical protein